MYIRSRRVGNKLFRQLAGSMEDLDRFKYCADLSSGHKPLLAAASSIAHMAGTDSDFANWTVYCEYFTDHV